MRHPGGWVGFAGPEGTAWPETLRSVSPDTSAQFRALTGSGLPTGRPRPWEQGLAMPPGAHCSLPLGAERDAEVRASLLVVGPVRAAACKPGAQRASWRPDAENLPGPGSGLPGTGVGAHVAAAQTAAPAQAPALSPAASRTFRCSEDLSAGTALHDKGKNCSLPSDRDALCVPPTRWLTKCSGFSPSTPRADTK